MIDLIAAFILAFGSILAVLAGIGVARLPDVFIRMHAATKVGTLSSGLILAGVALTFGDANVVVRCILIIFFLLLTAPIGAHMVGRAAVRMGIEPWTPEDPRANRPDDGHDVGGDRTG